MCSSSVSVAYVVHLGIVFSKTALQKTDDKYYCSPSTFLIMQVGVFPRDVKRMTLMSKVMVLPQIQCLPIHHAPIGQFLYYEVGMLSLSLCLISTGKYHIHFLST